MKSEATTLIRNTPQSVTGSHTMQILLLAALAVAVVAVAKLLATPVQQQPRLVPIRIRSGEASRRR
ncbi:hypothetical protein BI347_20260 [Chromobacterium sphagni]|uniref:Uncharacterized protein n=1 Tax=Chromobacterium sphagni TaxID=1903179 RepID=A0A1S1WUH6_9NEIS|nr:hypothetical protein BI347_20260 [Chromobacterium sphagni]OHX19527.1 hypothetical protein BI344_17895 [Chromobacterium sphagni]